MNWQKVIAGFNIFSLLLQVVFPIISFVSTPVFALATPKTELKFENSKFKIEVKDSVNAEYLLAYETDEKTEAVTGNLDVDGVNSKDEVQAGTCSANDCINHKVKHGVLKTHGKDGSFTHVLVFKVQNGQLDIVKEGTGTWPELTEEEITWLGAPTDENLEKVSLGTTESVPAPPKVETTEPNTGELHNVIVPNKDAQSLQEEIEKSNLDATQLENTVPTVVSDKADYAPTDAATITGTGFAPNTELTLFFTGSGNFAFQVNVTTNDQGEFIYVFQLDGVYRPQYYLDVKDQAGNLLAQTSFTDSRTINSATLNGGATTTIAPSANVTASVTVQTSGSGSDNDWESTSYKVGSAAAVCVNTADHNSSGTYTENFTIVAPASNGSYNVAFIAYQDPGCTGNASNTLTLTNGIVVSGPDLTVTKTASDATPDFGQTFTWTLTVNNGGTAPVSFDNQQILKDQLPSNTDASYSPTSNIPVTTAGGVTGSIDCDISSGDLICDDNDGGSAVVIPAGGSFSVTITVTPKITGALVNPRTSGVCKVDPNNNKTESNENNNTCSNTATIAAPSVTTNPALPQSCGLDVALVIDNSNSISSSELTQIKTAFKGFVDALLPATPTHFSVTRFNNTATVIQAFNNNATITKNAIDGVPTTSGTNTNWEDGLMKAQATFTGAYPPGDPTAKPNLVIFASDGDPTTNNANQPSGISETNALNPAIVVANSIKSSGTRVVALGISSSPDVENLKKISGPNVGSSVTSDVIISDFDDLAANLAAYANNLCGGTITVTKKVDADGNLNTTNDQTVASGWSFNIGGTTKVTDANGQTEAVELANGTYSVTETVKPGYSVLSGVCTGANNNGTRSNNVISGIQLGSDNIVSCTFINKLNTGSITIIKDAQPNDAQNFAFTTSAGLSNFNLDDDSDPNLSNTKVFSNVSAGTYEVTEGVTSGWSLTGLTCTGAPNSSVSLANRKATIVLGAGENATCTFTNAKDTGTITINKVVVPSNDAGKFNLQIDGSTAGTGANVGHGGTTGAITVTTGSHTVGETAGTNTVLGNYTTSIVCDTQQGSGTSLQVSVTKGQNLVCTITNTLNKGSIKVNKLYDADANGTYESVNPAAFTWSLDGAGTNTMGSTVSNITPGSHTVNENNVADTHLVGWYPGGVGSTQYTCSNLPAGGQYHALPATVSVTANQTTEITICNAKNTGTVIVHKEVQGPNGELVFDNAANFEIRLDNGSANLLTDNGDVTFNNVVVGSHEVDETNVPTNYTLYGIALGDGQPGNTNGLVFNVASGVTTHVYVTNRQKPGSITINKKVDSNGDGTFEGGNTEANTLGFSWTLDGAGTNAMGSTVNTIVPGVHSVSENLATDYHFVGWYPNNTNYSCTNLPTDQQYHVLPITVNVGPNGSTNLTICNAKDTGTVIVNKRVDTDGDNYYEGGNTEANTLGFKWGLDAQTPARDMGTSATNVNTGNHTISEATASGYVFTGWYPTNQDYSCSYPFSTDMPSFDLANQETVNITLCNKAEDPDLFLAKSNNAVGDKSPGDSVIFTLTVTATQSAVNDVTVIDLPASGFAYQAGSWTAHSTVRGDLKAANITTEPTYASPGTWQLGDMVAGEVVTLTYQANISGSQYPGLYPDLAWAQGNSAGGADVLANDMTGIFVGTEVNVVKDTQSYTSTNIVKNETKIQGQVLGASTFLPATGAANIWMIVATILTTIGLGGIVARMLSKKAIGFAIGLVLAVSALSFFGATPALAANLSVRMEEPKSPTNVDNFPVIWVTLDIANRPVDIKCFKKGPSDGSFSQFGSTQTTSNGGNTGTCQVNSSILSQNGTYQFYVEASVGASGSYGAETQDSNLFAVDYNTSGPGTPTNYLKEGPNACQYKISFKTADDGGKTVKVEIYRSENTSFNLDAGTRVATIAIGSNASHTHTDNLPDCSKTYYYALRAFDSAGNGSGVIGDSVINVTTISSGTSGSTTSLTGTAGTSGASGAIPVSGVTIPTGPSVLGNEANTSSTSTESGNQGDALGTESAEVIDVTEPTSSNRNNLLIGGGLLVLFGIIVYVLYRRKIKA